MKIALAALHHTDSDAYLNDVAVFLAERGDDVAIVCKSHGRAPHARVRFAEVGGFGLSAAGKLKAFAKSAEEHTARAGYDVVVGHGDTSTQDLVRLERGLVATRLSVAAQAVDPRKGERAFKASGEDEALLELEKRALERGRYKLVLVSSELVGKDLMRRYGTFPEAIRLIQPGVDLERFHPRAKANSGAAVRARLGLGSDDTVLLFQADDAEHGGLERVLKVLSEVVRERPKTKLLVAGDAAHAGSFAGQAKTLGVETRVVFAREPIETTELHAASDLFVLPTRYDPFAPATLEAMASGLAVITSGTNGACELIEQDESGSVLVSGENQALYRELMSWTKPERFQSGGARSRVIAERHGRSDKLAEIARVIDEIAAMRSNA